MVLIVKCSILWYTYTSVCEMWMPWATINCHVDICCWGITYSVIWPNMFSLFWSSHLINVEMPRFPFQSMNNLNQKQFRTVHQWEIIAQARTGYFQSVIKTNIFFCEIQEQHFFMYKKLRPSSDNQMLFSLIPTIALSTNLYCCGLKVSYWLELGFIYYINCMVDFIFYTFLCIMFKWYDC